MYFFSNDNTTNKRHHELKLFVATDTFQTFGKARNKNCSFKFFTFHFQGKNFQAQIFGLEDNALSTCEDYLLGIMSSPLRDEPSNDETPVENPSVLEES